VVKKKNQILVQLPGKELVNIWQLHERCQTKGFEKGYFDTPFSLLTQLKGIKTFKSTGIDHVVQPYKTGITMALKAYIYTGRFIMFSVITNIYKNNNCSQPQEN
jgi:hypothetical protein